MIYEIKEKLGEGSMGAVYRARDTRLDREVALRVLPEGLTADPAWSARFRREVRAAASLQHPGICAIYDVGESDGRRHIAMELLEGKSLRDATQGRPLAPDRILRIGIEIAEALEAAAAKGLIHERLTLDNVFLTWAGHAKILDFGLARPTDAGRARKNLATDAASEIPPEYRRVAWTTPAAFPTMSPEQAHGETLDARSDLFSLGAILYELAVGAPTFAGKTEPLLFQEILAKNPAPPEKLNPEIWPRLSELILRLLEKDRELRYQTAADVSAELKRIGRDYKLRQEISRESAAVSAMAGFDKAAFATDAGSARGATSSPNRWHRLRRPAFALPLCALGIVAVAFSLMRATASPEYIPYIEFSPFGNVGKTEHATTIEFVLRQTLSQFSDVSVLTPGEFAHLRKAAMERGAADAGGRGSAWWIWRPWRRGEPEPAMRLSGSVRSDAAALEVRLDCTVRGRRRTLAARFSRMDDFLNREADLLARQLLGLWSPETAARHLEDYRPAAQLLSPRWDAIFHYSRGALAWERLNIAEAERELRSAIGIDPNLALAHLALGEVRIFQNQWDAAQSEILAARRRSSTLTEVDQWRVEAFLARVFSKPLEERRYFQKVIELQPYRKENFYELAESYFHTADADEAIARYLEALDLDPGYAPAWNHLAYCYSWRGEHDKAIAAGRKYLELDGSANAADSLGDAYTQAGDYENARAMKLKALALDPQIHYATRTLAFIDGLHGDFAAAKAKFQSLLDVTDDKVQAAQYYADLGFLHYRAGRLDAAEELCARGLRLLAAAQYEVPHDELIWIRGMIAIARRDFSTARAALGQLRVLLDVGAIDAVNYKPAYKYWLYLNAAILASEGGGAEGVRKAEAVASLNDLKFIRNKLGYWSTPYDCAFFMDAVGLLYEKMELAQPAEDAFREAISYNRNFPTAHLHLAALLSRRGANDEARAEAGLFRSVWKDADGIFPETAATRR